MIRTRQEWHEYCMKRLESEDQVDQVDILADWQEDTRELERELERLRAHLALYQSGMTVTHAAPGETDEDSGRGYALPHFCGNCGHKLQAVRPGKYQCNNPECT